MQATHSGTLVFKFLSLLTILFLWEAVFMLSTSEAFWQKRVIGSKYFLNRQAHRINVLINKIEKLLDEEKEEQAGEEIMKAKAEIEKFLPGDDNFMQQHRNEQDSKLKELESQLGYLKEYKRLDSLFNQEEKEFQGLNDEIRSNFDDSNFKGYLLGKYSKDDYKLGRVYVLYKDYKTALAHFDKVPSDKALYLKGLCHLEYANQERANSPAESIKSYREAKQTFLQLEKKKAQKDQISELAKENRVKASAWQLWLILQRDVFGQNMDFERVIELSYEPWKLEFNLDEMYGLCLNANSFEDVYGEEPELSSLYLGWLYSSLGLYKKARIYLSYSKQVDQGNQKILAHYLYAQMLERSHIFNLLQQPKGQPELMKEAYQAYQDTLQLARGSQYPWATKIEEAISSKVEGLSWIFEQKKVERLPAVYRGVCRDFEQVRLALRTDPNNVYLQQLMMSMLIKDWERFGEIGFSFRSDDGLYALYIDDQQSKASLADKIKLICALQIFLGKDYVKIQKDKIPISKNIDSKSLVDIDPNSASRFITSNFIRDDILESDTRTKRDFFSFVKTSEKASSASNNADYVSNWRKFFLQLGQLADPSETNGKIEDQAIGFRIWLATRRLYDQANLYEEKGMIYKAIEHYLGAVSLIPTSGAYYKLGLMLQKLKKEVGTANELQLEGYTVDYTIAACWQEALRLLAFESDLALDYSYKADRFELDRELQDLDSKTWDRQLSFNIFLELPNLQQVSKVISTTSSTGSTGSASKIRDEKPVLTPSRKLQKFSSNFTTSDIIKHYFSLIENAIDSEEKSKLINELEEQVEKKIDELRKGNIEEMLSCLLYYIVIESRLDYRKTLEKVKEKIDKESRASSNDLIQKYREELEEIENIGKRKGMDR